MDDINKEVKGIKPRVRADASMYDRHTNSDEINFIRYLGRDRWLIGPSRLSRLELLEKYLAAFKVRDDYQNMSQELIIAFVEKEISVEKNGGARF